MRLTIIGALIGLSISLCSFADDSRLALEPIFNGKDLSGWNVPDDNPWWKVVDGSLIGENDEKLRGHTLYTEKSYKDAIIEADVRFTGEVDSGIYLRKAAPPAKGEVQVQIGVSRSLKKDMTCSLYIHGKYPEPAQAKNAEKLLKAGDWNTIRIQAIGSNYKVWLNGEPVVDCDDPAFPNAAPIGLQVHGGVKMKVEFRNLKALAIN